MLKEIFGMKKCQKSFLFLVMLWYREKQKYRSVKNTASGNEEP